jgi:hypothetical protein
MTRLAMKQRVFCEKAASQRRYKQNLKATLLLKENSFYFHGLKEG